MRNLPEDARLHDKALSLKLKAKRRGGGTQQLHDNVYRIPGWKNALFKLSQEGESCATRDQRQLAHTASSFKLGVFLATCCIIPIGLPLAEEEQET